MTNMVNLGRVLNAEDGERGESGECEDSGDKSTSKYFVIKDKEKFSPQYIIEHYIDTWKFSR